MSKYIIYNLKIYKIIFKVSLLKGQEISLINKVIFISKAK